MPSKREDLLKVKKPEFTHFIKFAESRPTGDKAIFRSIRELCRPGHFQACSLLGFSSGASSD